MKWIPGGVTAAQGFRATGISAGIKRGHKLDLALVVSDLPASVAAVLTRNRVCAAPLEITRRRVQAGIAQAILLNSGCANCLTGAAGVRDALQAGRQMAKAIGCNERDILLASTGMIGTRLPMGKLTRAIPTLVRRLSRFGHRQAAQAILTTDTRAKEVAVADRLDGRVCYLGGMAKGAGMIAPSMATMLCVITTDVTIAPSLLHRLLRETAERTFNRISVDGDMSTNDTVCVLANGRSGVSIRPGSPSVSQFARMLEAVSKQLAKLLVQDGEGATRIMTVQVLGARTPQQAMSCARGVARSPLVKTMLAGGDPNVGRIAAAVGASQAVFDPARLEIVIGSQRVVAGGAVIPLSKAATRRLLRHPEVTVRIHLHAGRAHTHVVTCDLTEEYVRINARYST